MNSALIGVLNFFDIFIIFLYFYSIPNDIDQLNPSRPNPGLKEKT